MSVNLCLLLGNFPSVPPKKLRPFSNCSLPNQTDNWSIISIRVTCKWVSHLRHVPLGLPQSLIAIETTLKTNGYEEKCYDDKYGIYERQQIHWPADQTRRQDIHRTEIRTIFSITCHRLTDFSSSRSDRYQSHIIILPGFCSTVNRFLYVRGKQP